MGVSFDLFATWPPFLKMTQQIVLLASRVFPQCRHLFQHILPELLDGCQVQGIALAFAMATCHSRKPCGSDTNTSRDSVRVETWESASVRAPFALGILSDVQKVRDPRDKMLR